MLLLLKDQHCAVLVRRDESGRLLILPSENQGGEQWVAPEQLAQRYTGQALFASPHHELEQLRSPLLPLSLIHK